MFLVATIGVPEIAIVAVAIGWIALAGRRRGRCCTRRVPLTLVAIASIVGGFLIFAHKSEERYQEPVASHVVRSDNRSDNVHERMARRIEQRVQQHVRQLEQRLEGIPDDHLEQVERRIEQDTEQLEQSLSHIPEFVVTVNDEPSDGNEAMPQPDLRVPVDAQWLDRESRPAEATPVRFETHNRTPHWMLIALGTILVIGGWMLVNRDRARPRALKAVTLLGVGATCFILFSLFHTDGPRRITRSHDRVVKISSDEEETTSSVAARATPSAIRPSRGPGPIGRARRPARRDVSLEDMPPRAGGIPVDEEPAALEAAETSASAAAENPAKVETPATDGPAIPSGTEEPATESEQPASEDEQSTGVVSRPSKASVKKSSGTRGLWHELWEIAAEAIDEALESHREEAERVREKLVESIEEARQRKLEEIEEVREKKREATEEAGPQDSKRAVAIASDTGKDADSDTKNDAQQKADGARPAVASAAEAQEVAAAIEQPAWLDMPGQLVDSVYRVSVKSGLYVDVPECQRHLEAAAKQCINNYIEQYLGEGTSDLVDIDRDYIDQVIKKAEFSEVEQRPSWPMPMHQIHALLEIDDGARTTFQEKWRQAIVKERLWQVGSGVAVVLALLSTFYGYMKLDGQTGGAHKGKLQLAATLLALVVAAGALLARWAVPL